MCDAAKSIWSWTRKHTSCIYYQQLSLRLTSIVIYRNLEGIIKWYYHSRHRILHSIRNLIYFSQLMYRGCLIPTNVADLGRERGEKKETGTHNEDEEGPHDLGPIQYSSGYTITPQDLVERDLSFPNFYRAHYHEWKFLLLGRSPRWWISRWCQSLPITIRRQVQ